MHSQSSLENCLLISQARSNATMSKKDLTQGTLFEQPAKEKKYLTIYGFYGRDLWLGLVENKKKQGEEDLLFKFMLGQRQGENLVSWLPVVIRGKAAEKFLEIMPELTAKDTLSLRGVYQDRTRNSRDAREFWAFAIKKVERAE